MKFLKIVLIGLIGLSLTGCGYLSVFLACIPKPYIEHPHSIKLDYYDNPGWWDYKNLSLIRQRINDYLSENNDIDHTIRNSLQNLSFQKGMTKKEVVLVIGEPTRKKVLKDKTEQWQYSGAKGGVLQWYYHWGKLTFSNDKLADIEVQYVEMCDL